MITLLLCLTALAGDEIAVVDAALAPPAGPDRSGPPAVEAPVPLDLPSPELHLLRPGLNVQHVRVEGVRKVEVAVVFHRGALDLCGAWTASCDAVGNVWDLAGGDLDAGALEARMDGLDGNLSSWVSSRDSTLVMSVPMENLADGLEVQKKVLLHPTFPTAEIKRSAKDKVDSLTKTGPADLGTVANAAARFGWYPSTHPYGARPDLKAWKKVKSGDLASLHSRLLAEAPVTVVVVGDIGWSELEAPLTSLLEGVGVDGPRKTGEAFEAAAGTHIVAVDMPGQEQTALRFYQMAPKHDAADNKAFEAATFALGGSFLSRINRNLREEKGWTYGSWAAYSDFDEYGLFQVKVDVKAPVSADAIREIEAELAKVVSAGVTPEEIEAGWRDEVGSWNRNLETAGDARGFYSGLLSRQEDVAARRSWLEGYASVTPAQAQAAAATWLSPDGPREWVVVGDRATLEPQLATLGWTVTWLTPAQAILGSF